MMLCNKRNIVGTDHDRTVVHIRRRDSEQSTFGVRDKDASESFVVVPMLVRIDLRTDGKPAKIPHLYTKNLARSNKDAYQLPLLAETSTCGGIMLIPRPPRSFWRARNIFPLNKPEIEVMRPSVKKVKQFQMLRS
jgi:hypothetical protein